MINPLEIPKDQNPEPNNMSKTAGALLSLTVDSDPQRISLADTEKFEREGFDGYIYVDTPDLKMLQVDVHGRHPRKRMISGVRTYTVLGGEGTFTLGDETYTINKGDLFVIPEGGEYEYEGTMTLFEANASVDGHIQDEKLE